MKQIAKSKRSQVFHIPFGMIFSIILIIAFIALAIYVIIFFLNMKKCTQIGIYKEDLQDGVDRAWMSDETSETFSGTLPGNIERVCFVDIVGEGRGTYAEYFDILKKYGYSPETNMFFWPLKEARKCKLTSFEIKHLDIDKITEQENPYCVNVVNSKIELKIEKGFYDALVKII